MPPARDIVKKSCFGVLILAVSLTTTRAAVLLSDSFDYSDGSLVTNSVGKWTNHSGTLGELKVISGRAFVTQNNLEDVGSSLAGQPYGSTTNILLYAGFTINFTNSPSGVGGYFAHFKAAGASGFCGKVFATTNNVPNGFFRVGVSKTSSTLTSAVFLTNNLSYNTDYTLVVRYAPSNSASALWLNPASESDPAAIATDSSSAISVAAFALRESFASPDGMGAVFLDNLVVATSFSEAISNPAPTAPFITTQPSSQTVTPGANVTFTVVAGGTTPLSYQWQFNGTNLASATLSALSLTNVNSTNAGNYTVTITNVAGTTNSQIAALTVTNALTPPVITTQPISQIATQGDNVSFTVVATGNPPPGYQWQFNGTNLAGATTSALTLLAVTTNQSGNYSALATNSAGTTNSATATLTVYPAAVPVVSSNTLSILHYNVKGNGASNWTTNATQVKAIARQLQYLNPDIIDFNEIPNDFVYEMTNWVTAFLPGYAIATNSGTDGFIRSVIASRFPITRSRSWLTHSNLSAFGYNGVFTRDLFEAQIAVPGFPQPLHVFTTHLKAQSTQTDSTRRGAEAAAISNFFVNVYFTSNSLHPYVLNGDLNEDIFRPEPGYPSGQPVQKLISPPTGLQLTTPVNPISGNDLTLSIQSTLDVRFDYILPCGLLFSNIVSSQVFRTDRLNPVPLNLNSNDDKVASDHLPVFMVFANPYDKPFRLISVTRTNPAVTLKWESVFGQPYRVESSTNLAQWTTLAANLVATNVTFTYSTNLPDVLRYFRIYRVP